jgi:NitT/TauT family transport system substrate-binding protein
LSLRTKLAACVRPICVGGLTLVLASIAAHAQEPLKKVRIAYGGGPALTSATPWLLLPGALGYWRAEGLDVELILAPGSQHAIQRLVAGQADVVQINSAPLVQAATNNGMLIRTMMMNTVIDWSLAVADDSPIQTMADFKGKAIGTANPLSSGVAMLKPFLQAKGIVPGKDVQIVTIGGRQTAGGALKSDWVQALFYRQTALAGLENTGLAFRSFFDPEWRRLPGFSMAALHGTITRDPRTIEGLVRGAAKASLFAATNPDCARRVQWTSFQAIKPSGADDVTLARQDLHLLDSRLTGMKLALDLSGGKEWGKTTPDQFARLQDLFLRTGLIAKKLVNPADFIIGVPDFFAKANAFDRDAIVTAAKACDVKS